MVGEADSISDHIKALMHRSHGDMMNMLTVADMANMQQRQQSNMDRMNAQVDAQLRKCNPDYKPPEGDGDSSTFINAGMMTIEQLAQMEAEDDGMGNRTFINAGLLVDTNTAKALMAQAVKDASGVPIPPVAPPIETATPPIAPPIQPPAVSSAPPTLAKSFGGLLWSGAKQLLPLLAVAGVSIAAARYFSPKDTDTNSSYSIEAEPYVPESQPQP